MKKITTLSLSLLILILILSPLPAASQPVEEKPRVAVYMSGTEPEGAEGVHRVLGSELAKAITESGRYQAVDRTEAILKQIEQEHVYQRSGAVSDAQIKELGVQLDVGYLCVAEVSEVRAGFFFLEARLVNIETAEVLGVASANSDLKGGAAIMRAAELVARRLLGVGVSRFVSGQADFNVGYQQTSFDTLLDKSGGVYMSFGAAGYLRMGNMMRIGLAAGGSVGWDSQGDGEGYRASARDIAAYISPLCRVGLEKRYGEISFTARIPVSTKTTIETPDGYSREFYYDDAKNMYSLDLSGRFDSFGAGFGYSLSHKITLLNIHGFMPVYKTIEVIPSVTYSIGEEWSSLGLGVGAGVRF